MKTRNVWWKNLANSKVREALEEQEAAAKAALEPKDDRPNAYPPPLTPAQFSFIPVSTGNRSARINRGSTDYTDLYDTSCSSSSSSESELDVDADGFLKQPDMTAPTGRPSLKLKLGSNITPATSNSATNTPAPQSAVRTPSIKLNFSSNKPSFSFAPSATTPTTLKLKTPIADPAASSAKKRKRDEDLPKPIRKLTINTPKTPAPAPIFKLKTKGKVPKRAPGVGYDSELEDREIDPVILEGFILRMPAGPDSDYIRESIRTGKLGVHRHQGGADVRMRFFDTLGRRGIIIVNGNQYATTVVDLPCIIEGMKSWDKKAWVKSLDITQMMIVLGRCDTDEQAKNHDLPAGVDPRTFAYAHGLTAPMHNVRKRRFARTKRANVNDIESVERRVQQLILADSKAAHVSYQILNHNPDQELDQDSADDYDDQQDAEGEEDDDYFNTRDGHGGAMVGTPMAADEIQQDDLDLFEAAFASDDEADDKVSNNNNNTTTIPKPTTNPQPLHLSTTIARDTSVAITSASASPTAAATPATTTTDQGGPASDSDSDADEDDDDSDRDDAEKDADENLQQAKGRIADVEGKIREQTEQLKKTSNAILRKKLAVKIQQLRDDVAMMKKAVGLGGGDDDGDDGDE